MKNKISIIILMLIASISFSQLNISTDYREDLIWNDNTEDWEEFSSENSITFFEFEDTAQSKMGMFIHRTGDITSAYLIKSYKYSEEYDWDEFDIVSDVGNKYTLFVKIGDEESDGYLWLAYKNKEDVYQAVKHRIKSIWVTENEEESEKTENDNRDWNGGGTGFFIDQSGYLATNYHVVEDAKYIEIEFYRDGELQTHKVEVVKEDKNNDLAILKISDSDFEKFDALPYYFSTRVVDVGEEVFALGYPLTNYLGKDIKFTDGKISSKTGYDGDIANYQTTTPIQPGNSGGPLFDYDGNLIAINAARFIHENSQNVSYSIKSSYLKNLIDVLPKKIRLPNNRDIKDLKLTEKIKVLSDYVVLIKIR